MLLQLQHCHQQIAAKHCVFCKGGELCNSLVGGSPDAVLPERILQNYEDVIFLRDLAHSGEALQPHDALFAD